MFSVIRRKYGNFVLSKSFETQKKELIFILIAYNVDRKLILELVWIRVSPEPPTLNLLYFRFLSCSGPGSSVWIERCPPKA